MRKRLFPVLLILFVLTGCASPAPEKAEEPENPPQAEAPVIPEPEIKPEPVEIPEPEPDPREEAVEAVLGGMTLEEKVGQMFFPKCPAAGALEKVEKYHPGGYLLFTVDFKIGRAHV